MWKLDILTKANEKKTILKSRENQKILVLKQHYQE